MNPHASISISVSAKGEDRGKAQRQGTEHTRASAVLATRKAEQYTGLILEPGRVPRAKSLAAWVPGLPIRMHFNQVRQKTFESRIWSCLRNTPAWRGWDSAIMHTPLGLRTRPGSLEIYNKLINLESLG